jgi:hypothetical protein
MSATLRLGIHGHHPLRQRERKFEPLSGRRIRDGMIARVEKCTCKFSMNQISLQNRCQCRQLLPRAPGNTKARFVKDLIAVSYAFCDFYCFKFIEIAICNCFYNRDLLYVCNSYLVDRDSERFIEYLSIHIRKLWTNQRDQKYIKSVQSLSCSSSTGRSSSGMSSCRIFMAFWKSMSLSDWSPAVFSRQPIFHIARAACASLCVSEVNASMAAPRFSLLNSSSTVSRCRGYQEKAHLAFLVSFCRIQSTPRL